ncbi:MAG: UbiD family decarboxylase [Desulfovibrio sp.]
MGYKNLGDCLNDLESRGDLFRIECEVDARIEAGVIQRKVFEAGGPALLFTNVKGCSFPMAANVFGTMDRLKYIFRDTLENVERLMKLKLDPSAILKKPWQYAATPKVAYNTLPRKVKTGPVMENETTISALPDLVSWPMDGGGYVTLPQVYSESPSAPGFAKSNLGMYRVQLSGNDFIQDEEVGLHYQIHRGIGHHHSEAISRGEPLRVNVFVGGPPAMTVAAVMPLPEGMSELFFAGALGGNRIDMVTRKGMLPVLAEADFCISGTIDPSSQKPEGPFGDHLGYYSLVHDFPTMKVDKVYHRSNAVWPFTTVGRPPQEDTMFGDFIHEMTSELVPSVFSGVHEVHAVDVAGVHPLLLAVGSERYVPYADERQPQELLTCAMNLLGNTQTALSKYVIIGAREDSADLTCHNIHDFLIHILERFDPERDLHFITRTTMDTLDYSGISLNQGSKLVWAACGPKRRVLGTSIPSSLSLPDGFKNPKVVMPGVLAVQGLKHDAARDTHDDAMFRLCEGLRGQKGLDRFPVIWVCDDSEFMAATEDNFLWAAFTRSDPATDIYGVDAFTNCKHWGCRGPVVIDARLKSYHAPALEPDPTVERKIEEMAAKGGPLHGLF